ncbi:transmembrane protein 87A-like [Physella acuta]|uniref:transmembrane protein 87A-like n=1 Tax=Physella acuta TaxID=109671 RepID=UPI0027DD83AC|nr:transmembrane protein 87A-like [Physella acuta]
MAATMLSSTLFLFAILFGYNYAKPQQGVWDSNINKESPLFFASKSIYKGGQLSVTIFCESNSNTTFKLSWIFRRSSCANEYVEVNSSVADYYLKMPWQKSLPTQRTEYVSGSGTYYCDKHNRITLHAANATHPVEATDPPTEKPTKPTESAGTEVPAPVKADTVKEGSDTKPAARKRRATEEGADKKKVEEEKKPAPKVAFSKEIDNDAQYLLKTWADGYYLFVLNLHHGEDFPEDFLLKVDVRISNGNSYIAAVDFPLLIFYGVMGLIYIGFGIMWLILLACNWRDLLRIQFWIGGVILLGMLEKAVFFGEYENINNTGQSVRGAIIFAELVSCLKRSLARMLVIIVSLGYGIVKPRLGQTFHKVLIVGVVFFILASIEGCMRALTEKAAQTTQQLLPGVPLAVTDAIICWWIFSSLLQTTRTLRLRRNIVKLSLYRHFTNTLIFAVIASVAYMVWFLVQHRFKECLSDWKELWMDDAFWHLLFSVILFVIMVLWRPTINNQRYAFSPLLDAADDDEEDDQSLNDAYEGMKMRSKNQKNGSTKLNDDQKNEDDLKWVEDNIPASLADKVLPALDSDEEIMNTKFEVSKME